MDNKLIKNGNKKSGKNVHAHIHKNLLRVKYQSNNRPSKIENCHLYMSGGVYKPRGQIMGEGVAQMTKTHNSYLVKVSTYGGGGQNCPKFCPRGLYTPPCLMGVIFLPYGQALKMALHSEMRSGAL